MIRTQRIAQNHDLQRFYWTNLAVSKDGSEAMIFDYNLMGKGYAYSDIRNITVSLSPDAAQAFLTKYGTSG